MEKVLNGVRVLDFTDRLAGPFCTRYLADCGCDVINLETPGGANCRTMPYLFDGQSTDFMYNHCGKKSIVVDLKSPEGRDLALRLAKVSMWWSRTSAPASWPGWVSIMQPSRR